MTGGGAPKRSVRLAEEIRVVIMDLLLRGEVHDPGVRNVLVSNVILSDDLRHARVYIRTIDPEVTDAVQRAAVRAMTRASGVIRRAVGARVRAKYTPDLKFFWDDAMDRGLRVEGVLEEIRRERLESEGKPESGDD